MIRLVLTMDQWNELAMDAIRKMHPEKIKAKPQFYRGNQRVALKDTAYGLPTSVTIELA